MKFIHILLINILLFSINILDAKSIKETSTSTKSPVKLFIDLEKNSPKINNTRDISLYNIDTLIENNRDVLLQKLNKQRSTEDLKTSKRRLLPDLDLNANTAYGNSLLLNKASAQNSAISTNIFGYQCQLGTEYEVYSGGFNRSRIEEMKHREKLSEEELTLVKEEITLKAYIILYDLHRNINYHKLITSSIYLREKEYERIDDLYKNGLVLKSDLLRSKLYITDLQRDEVSIKNSISILSDKLTTLLDLEKGTIINPILEHDLDHKIVGTYDDIINYTLNNSQIIQINKTSIDIEKSKLKEIQSQYIPSFKLYANYALGNINPAYKYNNQAYGEVGAKLNFSIGAFYKAPNQIKSQKINISHSKLNLENEREILKEEIYRLYTRYNEALINIERAKDKVEMSLESARILRNSYFNQQSLLIDVLEAETQSIESSFELVEATVNAQKYFWAIRQITGSILE